MPSIDTLKAARRLQEGGTFNPAQAERIAEVLAEAGGASATKADLDGVEDRLNSRIDKVEAQLNVRIDEVEKRLNARIDEVKAQLNTRIDELEERLTLRIDSVVERQKEMEKRLMQRIVLSEERTAKGREQMQIYLVRWMLGGFGAVAAIVSLLNYVF